MSGKTATPTGSALTDTEFFAPLVSAWQPQDDQSTHAAYTASDLMTAEGSATTGEDNTLHLSFTMNHRMALAVIEMPNTVKYKFTDERIPDYAVSPATTFSGIAQPLRVNDGTYRYLVNHATPAPTIEGHYDEGSKEFTITPSGLSTGSYKRYKVDGATTIQKDYHLQVGDFFLADGRVLPKDAEASVVQAADVVGIVFGSDLLCVGFTGRFLLGQMHFCPVVGSGCILGNDERVQVALQILLRQCVVCKCTGYGKFVALHRLCIGE